MKKINDEMTLFNQILTFISSHFGSKCEIVLHDLTKDYNHTIIDICNGHVTNREVGDCGSNLGLEVLRGSTKDGDRYNYVTHTQDGKILRSSSMYIKNDNGQVIGSICINLDITDTVKFEGFLKQYNHFELENEEIFVKDVNNLLDFLIQQGILLIGQTPEQMSKEKKMEFINYLDEKGAFLITKSGDKICELLGISKFTLYNYMEIMRNKKTQKA